MESIPNTPASGAAAIEALRSAGFSLAMIRPLLPKLMGTTTSRIAKQVGVSLPTVARSLRGQIRNPEVLLEISRLLKAPMEVLFPENNYRQKPSPRISG